jgi:uncharacterized protein YkwD
MNRIIHISTLLILFSSCAKEEPEEEKIIFADQIIVLVNEHRATNGLSDLELSQQTTTQAQSHSENMADGTTPYSHDGFNERFDILVEQINVVAMGENVAYGQTSAEQVMEDWINSEGHRTNIEGDYTHIGVGVAQDENGIYFFTQIFVKIR